MNLPGSHSDVVEGHTRPSAFGEEKPEPPYVGCYAGGRAALAGARAVAARAALAQCRLCAHECGINRLAGERGPCHARIHGRIFTAQTEVSDELELIPTFAIAFSGCDLRCAFCITGKESWNPRAGELFEPVALATRAVTALEEGARTIMILGGEPTLYLPDVLELISHLPDSAKLVWKTNAHGSAAARELLLGMVDVWLADYKFGNNTCAERLALVPRYCEVVQQNLLWASAHSELIIRHLAMPGHIDCCWRPVAEWIASYLPRTKVNLRTGFWPAWHARKHHELAGTTSPAEAIRAREIAREFQLNLVE